MLKLLYLKHYNIKEGVYKKRKF